MFINWRYLDTIMGSPLVKYFSIYMIFFFIIIGFLRDYLDPFSTTDYLGHIGGFVSGIFIYTLISRPVNPQDGVCCSYKYWFWTSAVSVGIFTITGFLCFYLLNKYSSDIKSEIAISV